jgi:malonyl-CoA O-methyltransferase
MLNYAREHKPEVSHWLCGDAESLPLADNSVDLMFSSLAIQWCENSAQLFAEVRRVLKPGGKFYVSTLGPGTLHELRLAWQAVDSEVHVNRFYSSEEMQQSILGSGLSVVAWERQERVLFYPVLKNLTHELKALGAHNVNQGKPSGLTGRQRIQNFRAAYETFRQPEGLPATYEVFYGVLQA